jgi:arylsulfatase A-like enzyme
MVTDRPNILLVVLDCVRDQDFKELLSKKSGTMSLASMARSSRVHTNTLAPATWTVPSHASLFTGLEPWEHSCNARASLRLSPAVSTIAERISNEGYETACFSANPWISDPTGLTRGFNCSFWGKAGDWLSHNPPRVATSQSGRTESYWAGRSDAQDFSRGHILDFLELVSHRYPVMLDAARRLFRGLEGNQHPHLPHGCEWIEPLFAQFVAGLPQKKPFFAFVNFLDAHEPYLLDSNEMANSRDWLSYYSYPQGSLYHVGREISPSSALDRMHALYTNAIERADARVGKLVEILRKAEKWDDTLVVVTSDHGQAFGENGLLFHHTDPLPHVARVPLMIRPPGGLRNPENDENWTSLSHVAEGLVGAAKLGNCVWKDPDSNDGESVALAAFDGFSTDFPLTFMLSKQQVQNVDRVTVAAYFQELCILASVGLSGYRYYDAWSGRPLTDVDSGRKEAIPEAVYHSIDNAIVRLTRGPSIASRNLPKENEGIRSRLEAWGYT